MLAFGTDVSAHLAKNGCKRRFPATIGRVSIPAASKSFLSLGMSSALLQMMGKQKLLFVSERFGIDRRKEALEIVFSNKDARIESLELRETEDRRELRVSEIVPIGQEEKPGVDVGEPGRLGRVHLGTVVPGHPVAPLDAHEFVEFRVIRGHHPTLNRRHVVPVIKAKGGPETRARPEPDPVRIRNAMGLANVLEKDGVWEPRPERLNRCPDAEQVRDKHDPDPLGTRKLVEVKAKVTQVNVAKHGFESQLNDGTHVGDPGARGDEHLVARLESVELLDGCEQQKVCRGPRGHE